MISIIFKGKTLADLKRQAENFLGRKTFKKPKIDQIGLYHKHKIEVFLNGISPENPVIAWWSGGLDSAIVCKLCLDRFGKENVRIIFIGTNNEDDDTYRFFTDCQKWYNKNIEVISSEKYREIQEVWREFLSLNVATGAICSSELKREVRIKFGRNNRFEYQAFGFDSKELKRANGMLKNYYFIKPIFPLIDAGYSKQDCLNILSKAGIRIPRVYGYGFHNNNCFKTGCVQGGVGYWQKMQVEFPDKFDAMAKMEHELTDEKGEPVTMLKDQSKKSPGLVFLKPHPDYPKLKHIGQMKGVPLKPLNECNGFCSKD